MVKAKGNKRGRKPSGLSANSTKMPRKNVSGLAGKRGRAVTITLKNGQKMLRVDYIRNRWEEGASRREIAEELSKIEGKPIRYQAVFSATKNLPGGKRERGKIDMLVLNGPNLNMLGKREPEIYGKETLQDIEAMCREATDELGLTMTFLQFNHEGALVEAIQQAPSQYKGIIINAAAYSHTSIAILDALKSIDIPVVEVHLSNLFKREAFRHHSYVSSVAKGLVCGFGGQGYQLAVLALAKLLK